MDAVWSMPVANPEPGEAGPAQGYPFGYSAQLGVSGGDRVDHFDDPPPGDLPETGLPRSLGFWSYDEAAARSLARRSGRGLLVSFYATWCEACVLIDRDTLGDSDVRAAIAERFVPLRIDVTEESRRGRADLERFGVYQLPAMVMLDPSGRVIDRVDSYLPPELFLVRLGQLEPALAQR